MKKILSVLLSLSLFCAASVPALADDAAEKEMAAAEQLAKLYQNVSDEYFGGAYINDSGDVVVCVTDAYDMDSGLIQAYTENDEIQIRTVRYTYTELEQAEDHVAAVFTALQDASERSEQAEALVSAFRGAGVDVEANALIVSLVDLDADKIALFRTLILDAECLSFSDADPSLHSITTPSSDSFPSDWAADEVSAAADLELLTAELWGDWQTPVTRGVLAREMLLLVSHTEETNGSAAQFTADVAAMAALRGIEYPGNVFTDTEDVFLNWASAFGIISGYDVRPDEAVTRQEAAVIFMNAYTIVCGAAADMERATYDAQMDDLDEIADWAVDSMLALYALDVMHGTGTGMDPQGLITMEQTVVMIYRLYQAMGGVL
ncbi:MAG: S-layer homology domain-containing protein [Oscillospiraceae bacterium]|nr:S-layer homology domain-containing protein [Oscillospiraceae bacterium]